MSDCRYVEWSRALLEPAPLDRVEPGTAWVLGGELGKDIDCDGAGVVITGLQAAIRAEDDDGLLVLGSATYSGTTIRVPYVVDADPTQRMYSLSATVTTSDGHTLIYWHSLPVVPTRFLHA